MDSKVLGERIAALRKSAGLTQRQLAEQLYVTDGAVSKWERGINYPDLATMESLASALNTDMLTLLGLENATGYQVAQTLSDISSQAKIRLIQELRFRCILNVGIGCMVFIGQFIANLLGIYGNGRGATIGICGFVSSLIASEVYFYRSLPKLCPKE